MQNTLYNDATKINIYLLSHRQDGEKGSFMVYDVYILRAGRRYYDKLHLRGSAEEFDRLEALLSRYGKRNLIDAYYMFELSPEDAEE